MGSDRPFSDSLSLFLAVLAEFLGHSFALGNGVWKSFNSCRFPEDEEANKEIDIKGGEKSEEIKVLDVLQTSDGEEVAALLEPPADSIDEGCVESLNDGDSNSSSDSSSDSESEEEIEDDGVDAKELKQQLIDFLDGKGRGIRASSDTRDEVTELISQFESKNPTPAPTDSLSLLNGKWILLYTSYSELYPLLAAGNLPLVEVAEVSQTIDAQALSVENSVLFESPVTTSFGTSVFFEIRSPNKAMGLLGLMFVRRGAYRPRGVKLEEGIISSPKVRDSAEIPSNLDIMGQKIDLSFAMGLLKPLQDVATTIIRNLSGQPPLKFSIQNDRAQSWLLTTFLEEDLRISRIDGGSMFVFLREGTTLLY
uniref:Plastid lipid-associated protein/fibrillin conserved domain-containing protein n=1 Tax=Physcomitrium patens TaxID=3218 RepID=A0A2K1K2I5_PHYPA|nr:hypothetical protein PHYPA_012461 [Physcomitrium patens]